MLRRTKCSSYSQLRPEACGRCFKFIPLRDGLSNPGCPTTITTRSISTRRRNVRPTVNSQPNPVVEQDASDSLATHDTAHSKVKSEHGEKQTFTITPRFKWSWRWSFVKDREQKRNTKDGTATKRMSSPEAVQSEHFVPLRSHQHQENLASTIQSLGAMAEALRIPPSPLETAVEESVWKQKRRPTDEERMRLAFNPWAMMLAGPIRYDVASRTRFPQALMLEMGVVTNPVSDQPYLVPDDLADLEAFNELLERGDRSVAMARLPRERGGTTLNMLPYKTLIEVLTDELVTWDGVSRKGTTKPGMIARRLIPRRWLERTEKINAYQDASKDYWKLKKELGEIDNEDELRREPEPPLNMKKLLWQFNVADRMYAIMRQRLLLAIEHLGRKTDDPQSKARRHFMCFAWPDSLYINVIAEANKFLGPQLAVNAQPDATSPDSTTPDHHDTFQEEFNDRDGRDASSRFWEPEESAALFADPEIWVPGSFFLHVGPPSQTLSALPYLRDQRPEQHNEPLGSHLQMSKFIPPMIQVSTTHRLPVFNLHALLGPEFEYPLNQILSLHNMVPSPDSQPPTPSPSPSLTPTEPGYLILIRGTAPVSHYIIQELWQLWRYVGGTDCLTINPPLPTSPHAVPIDPAERASDSQRKPRRSGSSSTRKNAFLLSQGLWDHFYELLPGIKPPAVQPAPATAAAEDKDAMLREMREWKEAQK